MVLERSASMSRGTGLHAQYYDNPNLTRLKFTRNDAEVNFDWGRAAPNAGARANQSSTLDTTIDPDTFSVRWQGQVQPLHSETYKFSVRSDDGVRLWVNRRKLIDRWTSLGLREAQGTVALEAGQKYDIRLDYRENLGAAAVQLLWSSPSQPKQVIPSSQLYNQLGTADAVPSPWTPIPQPQVNGNTQTVQVWGRTYQYSSPLPDSIVTQNQEVLAAPVRFFTDSGIGERTVSWTAPTVSAASPTQVTLSSRATIGTYSVQATTRIEYDGFTWSEFQFDASDAAELRSLRVEIPINQEHAKFLQYPYARDNRFQAFSEDLLGEQYLFVGNDYTGLQWFAESDQWWYAKDRKQMLQVQPTATGGVIKINMVRDAITMPASFKLAFGLMATPVRPRPERWRGFWNKGSTPAPQREQSDRHTLLSMDYGPWSISPGWLLSNNRNPMPWNPNDNIVWHPFTSTRFVGVRPYAETNADNVFPIWTQYQDEWLNLSDPGGTVYNPSGGGWNQALISPTPSYIEHFMTQAEAFFRNYDVDGLYMDGFAGQVPALNEQGFGYVDRDGQRQPIHPILASRELQRRLYGVVQQYRGTRGTLWMHTSTINLMPVLSFSDAVYDGEFMFWSDISEAIEQGGIRAGLTDDRLRTVLNQRQTGLVPTIDVRRINDAIRDRADTRQAIGLFLVNDIHAWGGLKYDDGRVIRALDRWGITDPEIEFHPYFADSPASTAGNRAMSSIWQKPNGQALMVVVNDRDSTRTLDVRLNLDKLGYTAGNFSAFDLEATSRAGVSVPIRDGNSVVVTVPARGMRLIALRKLSPS
jgi:hypothetical protein